MFPDLLPREKTSDVGLYPGPPASSPFKHLVLSADILEPLLDNAIEELGESLTHPVVMIAGVLVSQFHVKLEARAGNARDDPLAVPYGVAVAADGGRAPAEGPDIAGKGPGGDVDGGVDEGVAGEGVEVCDGEVGGAVEDDLDGVECVGAHRSRR